MIGKVAHDDTGTDAAGNGDQTLAQKQAQPAHHRQGTNSKGI